MALRNAWAKSKGDQPTVLCFWRLSGSDATKTDKALSFAKRNPPPDSVRHGVIAMLEDDTFSTPEAFNQFEACRYLVINVPQVLKEAVTADVLKYIHDELAKAAVATEKRMAEIGVSPVGNQDGDSDAMTPEQEQDFLDYINDPYNQGSLGPS